jgi:hypothetical protein
MKKLLFVICTLAATTSAVAQDNQGFFVGVGRAVTVNDDCGDFCDTRGSVLEAGYYFNEIVGLDLKYAKTKMREDNDIRLESTYAGVNLGHTFNTSWVRFYGKAGFFRLEEEDRLWGEKISDNDLALGIGATFYPIKHQSTLYIKVESLVFEFEGDDIGFAQFSLGYQF